jgi:hypothetical protein
MTAPDPLAEPPKKLLPTGGHPYMTLRVFFSWTGFEEQQTRAENFWSSRHKTINYEFNCSSRLRSSTASRGAMP